MEGGVVVVATADVVVAVVVIDESEDRSSSYRFHHHHLLLGETVTMWTMVMVHGWWNHPVRTWNVEKRNLSSQPSILRITMMIG
jgi:hypothetical protein